MNKQQLANRIWASANNMRNKIEEGVSKWTHPLFTPPFTLSTT